MMLLYLFRQEWIFSCFAMQKIEDLFPYQTDYLGIFLLMVDPRGELSTRSQHRALRWNFYLLVTPYSYPSFFYFLLSFFSPDFCCFWFFMYPSFFYFSCLYCSMYKFLYRILNSKPSLKQIMQKCKKIKLELIL